MMGNLVIVVDAHAVRQPRRRPRLRPRGSAHPRGPAPRSADVAGAVRGECASSGGRSAATGSRSSGGVVVRVLVAAGGAGARARAVGSRTGPTSSRSSTPPSRQPLARHRPARPRRALAHALRLAGLAGGRLRVGRHRHRHRHPARRRRRLPRRRCGRASIMRLVDLMLVFPRFFLLLAVLAFLKPSIWTIMAVIGLTGWMGVARLVRAEFLALSEREFVMWSQSIGASALPDHLAPHPAQRDGAGAGGHDPRHPRRHPDRVGAVVPGPRRAAALRDLGQHPQRGQGRDRDGLVAVGLSRAWPSWSPCSPTTCSARGSATRSIRGCARARGRVVSPRALAVYSAARRFVPKWRNWQTRTFEGRVGQPVGVRVPPSAPLICK